MARMTKPAAAAESRATQTAVGENAMHQLVTSVALVGKIAAYTPMVALVPEQHWVAPSGGGVHGTAGDGAGRPSSDADGGPSSDADYRAACWRGG
mmetsp:Transcript_24482/g.68085  ORF Transcript_24482/g.68085 Transcript_24482/m.68085 type:complete len:95 (+) Transcript_24482:815-1099(+)